ncbi:hypothetical protein HRbin36_02472 [bacterium HR36]|nr:hypothetical protein HRbin36_02472 [bacterium HR36]
MEKFCRLMAISLLAIFWAGAPLGCQSRSSDKPLKKISLEEYEKLPPEERDDPYVLQHLQNAPNTRRH